MGRLGRSTGALWRALSPTGRAVTLLGLAAWAVWAVTDLVELRLLALMCSLVLLLAIPWLLVPMRVTASLGLHSTRSVAGDVVQISLVATNGGRLSLWQPLVRLPIGTRDSWLRLPTLPPGERRTLEITTEPLERGVFDVGPAHAVRSDPLGLLRRWVSWCEPVELYVRPRMVLLSTLGSGHLRDLEGVPSDRISMSDLAFHALREYVPGDDLRHVHWRSSARAGELLVRQYHDTRRTHATIVLDPTPSAYASDEEYELGVSIAASLIMCAAREDYDVSLVSGNEQLTSLPAGYVLDGTCRVTREPNAEPLGAEVTLAITLAPETSMLFVVTGSDPVDLDGLTSGLVAVSPETHCVVLRAEPGAEGAVLRQHGHDSVTVGSLGDLPSLMARST